MYDPKTLNDEQLKAVECNDSRILCLAGAGTGKTHTMLNRICRLVDVDKVNPKSILVLTFTNAAAFEMKHRYEKMMNSSCVPTFGTFHSFCYSLILHDSAIRSHLGYSAAPTVVTPMIEKQITAEAMQLCGIKPVSNKSVLSPKSSYEQKIFNKTFKKLLRDRNYITFDLMCYDVCQLFDDNNPIIHQYKARYKYIFCDEWQDTDSKQDSFVQSFKDSNIFVVGDVLQNLYSFRGTDSSIIKRMAISQNWTTIRLTKNYRSTIEICEYAKKHSTYANPEYRTNLTSIRHGDKVIERMLTYDDIVAIIKSNPGSTAIICRTNAEVADLKSNLSERNILVNQASNETTINVIRSICNDEYLDDWLLSAMPQDYLMQYMRAMADPNADKYIVINNVLAKLPNLVKLYNTVMQIRGWLNDTSIEPEFNYRNICKELNIIPDDSIEVSSANDIIQWLSKFIDSDIPNDSEVYVGTIHSVKGLEYDNVVVWDVNSDYFRLDDEDSFNLFYVAITRAKNKLWVDWDQYNNGADYEDVF